MQQTVRYLIFSVSNRMLKPVFRISMLMGGLLFYNCQKELTSESIEQPFLYDSIPVIRPLSPVVNEISGIADSKNKKGFLWGHEDSGRPPQVHLISHDGTVVKKVFLKGISNRDWEDMDLFNNEIYIGEIGDNAESFSSYRIHKFNEPDANTDTVTSIETINFTYPDGSHDAEAFFVDPVTKHIYIITKRSKPSKLYKLSFPYAADNVVSYETDLPYTGVVGAAVSPDGREIIVKTYTHLYHYKRSSGAGIEKTLSKNYQTLPYLIEPQGEAVCFASNGSGYFTISEKGFSTGVSVYFYKRK